MKSIRLFIALILFSHSSFAQKDTTQSRLPVPDTAVTYRLELNDGSIYFGSILSEDVEKIQFQTLSKSRLDINKRDIKKREQLEAGDFVNGTYWFKNPNPTRYLFGPSAFNLKAGEGYYQNTYLLLNSFNVGLTDYLSIGGGFELLSTFVKGSEGPIFILTPKVGFEVSPRFHAGGGVLYLSVPSLFEGSRTGLGVGYGIGTYGTENSNITGGLGWGFVEGEFSSRPIATFSGMHRISRKVALVSENWLIPADTYYGVYSYGIRFFGEKIAIDLAFLNNSDISQGLIIGVPWIDFVVKF